MTRPAVLAEPPAEAGSAARWLAVWTRAVVVPAWRRAIALWIGCAIVAAVVFGPNGMRPKDLTGLALGDPGVGAVLAAIWLLGFAPTARLIVRPPAAAYLASLPGAPRAARLIATAALVGLQLPWLALWLIGDGLRGAVVVAATALIAAGLGRIQRPSRRTRPPRWRRAGQALRAIHRRALVRRAGDALARGAAISVLAGMAAGLLIRNNHLSGQPAGVLGASIIAIVLIPAQIGPAMVALAAHRDTAWIAAAYGIAPGARIAALVHATALIHLASAAIAAATAMAIAGATAWLAALALAVGLGTALGAARAILVHEASPSVASRLVIQAIAAAALAVVCLTVLGAAGAIAVLAIGGAALLVVKP
jgi:hypothetical protein